MNKALLAVGVAGILAYCMPVTAASATSAPNTSAYTDDMQPRTAGLVIQYDLSISAGSGCIIIDGSTVSNQNMWRIGFTDIVVEYSSDNSHWSPERTVNDIVKSSSEYMLDGYTVDVTGGYYYRITCNHYAKKSLFGSSQSVSNTSNSVWVP